MDLRLLRKKSSWQLPSNNFKTKKVVLIFFGRMATAKKLLKTRQSRLPQASERCFRKTPNIPPSCTSDFFLLFGVLRKHCSEACGRRLCLVSACIFWISRLKNNGISSPILIEQSYIAQKETGNWETEFLFGDGVFFTRPGFKGKLC